MNGLPFTVTRWTVFVLVLKMNIFSGLTGEAISKIVVTVSSTDLVEYSFFFPETNGHVLDAKSAHSPCIGASANKWFSRQSEPPMK